MSDPKEHFELEPHAEPGEKPADRPEPSRPANEPARAAPAAPPSPGEAPPLLELAVDTCPKCGTVLSHDAVFCIKCGYDLRTNEVRTPSLGVEHVVEKPKEPENEFSTPGRGSLNLLLAIGGALSVGAMIMAGLSAPPKAFPVIASVLLCLYEIALHTGTGLVAVLIAARIAELKPGRLDLAAGRMFVAFATFQLLHLITFGEYRTLVTLLMYPLGLAAYWGLVMLLFRKPRMIALTVLIAHFVLWIAVKAGMELAAYVDRSELEARLIERSAT